MKALLLIAHGSRREASNIEVIGIADKLAELSKNDFDLVKACFLELAEPGIARAVEACAKQGARDITVLPYFLSAGRHVAEDVPQELANAVEQHPGVSISICPHIGAIDAMPKLLYDTSIAA